MIEDRKDSLETITSLSNEERVIIDTYVGKVVGKFEDRIDSIWLYGSKAREDSTSESDIDILVAVPSEDRELLESLRDIAYDLQDKYDFRFIISVQIIPSSHIPEDKLSFYPFIHNVQVEGKRIWKRNN